MANERGPDSWILLTDYASKYRISVSTLRRRIKSQTIPHRFENGKYYLSDVAPDAKPSVAQAGDTLPGEQIAQDLSQQGQDEEQTDMGESVSAVFNLASLHEANRYEPPPLRLNPDEQRHFENDLAAESFYSSLSQEPSDPSRIHFQDKPLILTATKLLSELKRAYAVILQEKEEQIIYLKEEVSDLRTLVRVLEEDNERMRRGLPGHLR